MEGLLSLLIFAGLFYFMMRFGCGAHMIHGSHHGGHEKTDNNKHIDPVCGMEVDINSGYGKMHNEALYRFCSRDCLDKFDAEQDKFIQSQTIQGGAS